MEITTIKIRLKLSEETQAGWRGLEVGAEATIGKGENVDAASNKLYQQLRGEFPACGMPMGSPITAATKNSQSKRPIPSLLSSRKPDVQPVNETAELATEAQIRCIFGKAKAMGLPSKTVRETALSAYGTPIDSLAKWQASQFISSLNNRRIPS